MSQTIVHSSSSASEALSIRLTGAGRPIHTFALSGRLISNKDLPSFHVSTRSTKDGKLWQLAIARVLPSEARKLAEDPEALIRYDEELTVYSGKKMALPIRLVQAPMLAIHGHKRGTVSGSVTMEKSGRGTYKFFHITPIHHPMTLAENERMQALMHRRGYRDSDDWRKELLFTLKEGEWKFGKTVVAMERDGKLDVLDDEFDGGADLLAACWACKNFVLE